MDDIRPDMAESKAIFELLDELETEDMEETVSCENSELEFCKLEIIMMVFPFRFDPGAGPIFQKMQPALHRSTERVYEISTVLSVNGTIYPDLESVRVSFGFGKAQGISDLPVVGTAFGLGGQASKTRRDCRSFLASGQGKSGSDAQHDNRLVVEAVVIPLKPRHICQNGLGDLIG
jgi:hypothetical protein